MTACSLLRPGQSPVEGFVEASRNGLDPSLGGLAVILFILLYRLIANRPCRSWFAEKLPHKEGLNRELAEG
jgi:hypothetical protein